MKKSIRSIKKKFKAEKMHQLMSVAIECLPVFLPIAKHYSEIISKLGIDTDSSYYTAGGFYIHNEFYFKEMFDKLEKTFGQKFHIDDIRTKRELLSQIKFSEDDGDGMRW